MKTILIRAFALCCIIGICLALATAEHETLITLAFWFGAVLTGLCAVLLVCAGFVTGEELDEANGGEQ